MNEVRGYEPCRAVANIKVFGVGGGGNNAVNRMIDAGIQSAQFYAINTDEQALYLSRVPQKERRIQIGASLTHGLGCGADPEKGRQSAEESREAIVQLLEGTDLLFVTAGMGGGTGTGAAPVIASIAKEMGILTIAVVTKPFSFEANSRMKNAELGIANLRKSVDTLVIIPNDKLVSSFSRDITMLEAFTRADDVLRQGITGISDLIVFPSLINLDFADVCTVMRNKGMAHMGLGVGRGQNRTIDAIKQAVYSPLLETTIQGSTGLIININGGPNLTIHEVHEGVNLVKGVVDESAKVIFGADIREDMGEEVQVTIIATGFDSKHIVDKKKSSSNFFTDSGIMTPDDVNESTKDLYGSRLDDVFRMPKGSRESDSTQKKDAKPKNNTYDSVIKVEEDSDVPAFLRKLKK